MFKLPVLGVLLLLSLSACGSIQEGDDCSGTTGQCESAAAALICDRGSYRSFSCRGTGGCLTDTSRDTVLCSFGTFRKGDNCPIDIEGGFQCDPSNVDQVLECSSGVMKAQACKACALAGDKITCQQ